MYYKIFIDTNIYDGANYSFQNAAFSAIRSRGKNKELELHINSVVEGEVKKHIVRDVKKASKELLGAVKNPKLAGFKNISGFKELLQVPDPGEWAEKTKEEFEKLLLECQCRRISVSIPIEISILFGNSEHPFPERKNMPFRSRVQLFI